LGRSGDAVVAAVASSPDVDIANTLVVGDVDVVVDSDEDAFVVDDDIAFTVVAA
jgi:hypothetical protein